MTIPSVEVIPTRRPISLKMWAIIRTVVVFPLVPVTATIGIRAGVPGGTLSSAPPTTRRWPLDMRSGV